MTTTDVRTDEVRDRIRAGAAWLDERQPDWRERVTINELELDNTCRCVLGQVFTNDVKEIWAANPDALSWWVQDEIEMHEGDRDDGFFPGFTWMLGPENGDHDYDAALSYVVGDTEFLTSKGSVLLGFDHDPYGSHGPAYSYDLMTEEWRAYLNGEWT